MQQEKSEEPETTVPTTVTDGGARAWCTLLGGWLALYATFGYATSFGVYQDLYTRAGTSSSSNISWIGSVQLFFFISMGLPAGKLLDNGYFRHVMLIGSVIYIFSLFMLSLAHIDKYYQILLSQGIGMGLGAGLIYLPAIVVQAHHWRARRALAMGVVITGSSVGGIVYPIMLNRLFHNSVGFVWGVRASAFLNLGLLIIANLLMSAQLPSAKNQAENPKSNVMHFLRDGPFMATVIGIFLIVWGLFFPYFYLQLFTVLHGISPNFAFYTLTIQNAASIPGRTLPNLLADKLGVLNAMLLSSLASGILVFGLFGVTNIGGVTVFAIFYGFFSGAVLSLIPPALAGFSTNVAELGVRMGIAYFITSFSFLTGPPISGALLTNDNHWFRPIVFSGTIILAGVPFLLASQSVQARRKKTLRV